METKEKSGKLDERPNVNDTVPASSSRRHTRKNTEWRSVFLLELTVLGVLLPATVLTLSSRALVLEFVAILILSSLPALLYVRFVEFRGPSVWSEYVFNLHRLRVENNKAKLPRTLDDYRPRSDMESGKSIDGQEINIYTQKFDAHFGRSNRRRWQQGIDGDHSRQGSSLVQQLDLLFPILVSTIVVTIGWAFVFADPDFLAGGGPPLVEQVRAGFLGGYVFVLQFLVRRYFQNDLKASAYYAVTERIIVVAIVVAILNVASPLSNNAAIPTAFAVGMFPVVGLRAINSLVSRGLKSNIPSLQSAYPLSDLDGMTIWYETRLLEEGIEDMQNLTTANIVDLMLNTRIPVGRIVDWLDQAYLYIHLAPVEGPRRASKRKERGQEGPTGRDGSDRYLLRRYGIRCATDLEDAFAGYGKSTFLESRVSKADQGEYYRSLKNLINVGDGSPSVTLTVLNCLRREPNLEHVRSWKALDVMGEPTLPLGVTEAQQNGADGA